MLQSTTLKFLKDLKKNNSKTWFDAHRKQYDVAKADFYSFVDTLVFEVSKFDNSISNLKAKDCTFRINRDVRFSKDKSPYKSNMGASISKGGKKINCAGYYFHCEPGQIFAGGGFYMPAAPELNKIRQEIDYSFKEWKSIVDSKSFKKIYANGLAEMYSLKRPPKGYDENNPAIYYLKMKCFVATASFTDIDLQQKNAAKEIAKTFAALKPLIDFVNRALE